ncbi:MAG: hypothetical protein ACTSRW_07080 [Candidatus Helarchaeota archaeon]
MSLEKLANKSRLYNRLLNSTLEKMKQGHIMLLDNDGLTIAEKSKGISDLDPSFGAANRMIAAGEKALAELSQSSMINQTLESEKFFLMMGRVNQDISYAILAPKNARVSMGVLRLYAQQIRNQASAIDSCKATGF